jgi:hypothetical protein
MILAEGYDLVTTVGRHKGSAIADICDIAHLSNNQDDDGT